MLERRIDKTMRNPKSPQNAVCVCVCVCVHARARLRTLQVNAVNWLV